MLLTRSETSALYQTGQPDQDMDGWVSNGDN